MQSTFTIGNLTITRLCTKEQMDAFVDNLPPDKKTDVKEILKALIQAGMIEVFHDEHAKPN